MRGVFNKLGLENKEVDVYLALLKLGKSNVDNIKKDTGIERTHIYKILERLQDKNFVTQIYENKLKNFIPVNPENVLLNLKNTENDFKEIIPVLNNLCLKNPKEEIKITILRGKEGLKNLGEELLSTTKEYFVMGEQGRLEEVLPIYSHQFIKKLEKKGIKEKVLAKKGMKILRSKNTSVKYVSKNINFPTSTVIFNKKVAIIIWSEPLAIIIQSEEVAESYKKYFKMLWSAKR